jgi:hypothetical protein
MISFSHKEWIVRVNAFTVQRYLIIGGDSKKNGKEFGKNEIVLSP